MSYNYYDLLTNSKIIHYVNVHNNDIHAQQYKRIYIMSPVSVRRFWMVYQTQFTGEQVLEALSKDVPQNAPAVAKKVGCSPYTVKRILAQLEHECKARYIEIVTGSSDIRMKAWLRN